MPDEVAILKRMLERERKARQSAEKILEQKRLELETINAQLEEQVKKRTKELELLAKFPEHNPSPVMKITAEGIIEYANISSQGLLTFWKAGLHQKCPAYLILIVQKCLEKNINLELEIIDELDNGKIYSFIFSPDIQLRNVFAYGRNITSLKNVQQALNESKNQYKLLVEDASDVIHRTDITGRFTYVNPVSTKVVEYSELELIGKSYVSLIREDYKEKAVVFYKTQLQENIMETYFEFPILTKTGKEVWVGQNSKIIYKNKIADGFHSVARNITDRKNARLEAENTSNRLKILIGNLQAGVLMEDESRKIILVNKTFCEYFNIAADPSMLEGMDCTDSAEQSKDLFNDPEIFVKRIHEILRDKKRVLGELLELKNGRILERSYIPIYTDNKYMGHLWKYNDVTERKKADERLTKQKEFYESILNNIPTDIAVFDKDHKYVFLNPEAIKDEVLRKWIIGKNDFEYMAFRGKSASIAEIRRKRFEFVFNNKTLLKWEEKLTDADGSAVYRLRHMCPVLDEHNEVVNVIGIGLDITNERLIEEELRENENKLKIINQISHEFIINQDFNTTIHNVLNYISIASGSHAINVYQQQHDLDSNTVVLNHRFGRIVPEDVYTLNDIRYDGIHVESVFNSDIQEQLSEGKYIQFIAEMGDGLPDKIVQNSNTDALVIFPINVLNHVWGIIVFEYKVQTINWDEALKDILFGFSNAVGGAISRREAEEKLKAIVTSLDDIVLQINREYVYENIWVSDTSKLKFPKERYLNKAIPDVVDKTLAVMFIASIDEVFQTRGISTFIYKSPDVSNYYRGKVCYLNSESVSVLIQDISEQKLGEIELVKAREKAEHSVNAKEHFLANMSHEIRTPMNAIVGMTKLLNKTTLDIQQNSYLNAINISAKNLLGIINDILDFSKIGSEKLVLEKTGFRIKDVVSEVIKTIRYKTLEKKLSLTFDIDEKISPVLIGDPLRLNQILLNLVNNALKFTSVGGIHIVCKLESSTIDTHSIYFSVEDSGIGIKENKLHTIFESFTQEDETITRKYGGTGLGLSICKELVELHGGSIHVKSKKNEGTTFYFSIDYPLGTEGDVLAQNSDMPVEYDLSDVRVLLVEDNEINTFLAQTILENMKMVVEVAENGLIAIDKIKSSSFDVVLMDMQMPVMGGVESTIIIRNELNMTVPIIALTANAIKGDEQRCLEAGMNDYVSKPFDEKELIHKIAMLLNRNNETNFIEIVPAATSSELYSLHKLTEMSRGNTAFVDRMVKMFIDLTPVAVEKIKETYLNNDFDKMKATAHSIKPSIHSLAINTLAKDLKSIETFIKDDISFEELGHSIANVERTVALVVSDLKEKFQADR